MAVKIKAWLLINFFSHDLALILRAVRFSYFKSMRSIYSSYTDLSISWCVNWHPFGILFSMFHSGHAAELIIVNVTIILSSAHDSRRFDGVTVAAFERDRPLAWDATITHTCAPSHLAASVAAPENAARLADSASHTNTPT